MTLSSDARILVVEDDRRIREELLAALREAGFQAEPAGTMKDARLGLCHPVDLVLLDLGLPDGDGLDLCQQINRDHPALPVIILTARDGPDQRVRGLDVGADDYVVKPFHLPELLARVRTVLRRTAPERSLEKVELGRLWAEPQARAAGCEDRSLRLKPREFDLLLFLLQNPGRAWTRQQLLDRVWGSHFYGTDRTVDVHIGRLRAEIERNPRAPLYLKTVWGVGYRLEAPVDELAE